MMDYKEEQEQHIEEQAEDMEMDNDDALYLDCEMTAIGKPTPSSIVHGKFAPQCNDIQNLTLRLLHKWLALTLYPRVDIRTVRNDELIILYAMVNKIKISPVKSMIKQWLTNFKMTGPIECTSVITRIASSMGILEGNAIPFIEDDHVFIDGLFDLWSHTQGRPE
ncbi:hypothetical protein C2845_PM06G26210 [Panicum miliaceum]|uniref:Uncharacterized protein n=1 Tax=Panicum miliaceum TaxID=4540 RepID=A0A3L6RDD3_PANMI|nr:hypothetical protein C2845_PM06G26210 [Panicum miliaceum]